VAELPRALAWPAATVAAAAAAGALVGRGDAKLAVAPAVALVVVLFARVPVAGFICILWSVSTAVDMLWPPEVGISSLQFAPAEVLLWLSIGSLVFIPYSLRRTLAALAVRRESLALFALLGAVVAGVAVGMENGASLHDATFSMRYMLFYAAFWPALLALAYDRVLVMRLASVGVVAVVVLSIGQLIVGPSTHLFLIGSSDLSGAISSDDTGFLRIRPPGLTSVYVVGAFALARVLWGPARGRMLGWFMVAVTLTGVAVSANRNMLVGLVIGLAAAAVVTRQRHRVLVMAATVAAVVAALVLLAQSSAAIDSNPVVSRFASVTNYSELQTQTLDDRYYENGIALQRIRSHPIGGLGWGPDYGAYLLTSDDGFLVSTPRPFMHEQYLWIWMRAGIIGLGALIAMLAFGIWNGARYCRARHGGDDAWLGAGVVVAVVALAASSNVAIYLTPPDSTVPLVGALALAALLRRDLTRT
jgi:hypothetical protein